MPAIRRLPEAVANRIAAEEVVERPAQAAEGTDRA
jgi:DNA mismatch repair ATPase MutL